MNYLQLTQHGRMGRGQGWPAAGYAIMGLVLAVLILFFYMASPSNGDIYSKRA